MRLRTYEDQQQDGCLFVIIFIILRIRVYQQNLIFCLKIILGKRQALILGNVLQLGVFNG
jgi:hypothetical protein